MSLLGVLMFLWIVFLLVYGVLFCAHLRTHTNVAPANAAPTTATSIPNLGLNPREIESILAFPYAADGRAAATECAVCLGRFEEKQVVKRLPGCNHYFHGECINAWLIHDRTCPLCRHNVRIEPVMTLSAQGESAILRGAVGVYEEDGRSMRIMENRHS